MARPALSNFWSAHDYFVPQGPPQAVWSLMSFPSPDHVRRELLSLQNASREEQSQHLPIICAISKQLDEFLEDHLRKSEIVSKFLKLQSDDVSTIRQYLQQDPGSLKNSPDHRARDVFEYNSNPVRGFLGERWWFRHFQKNPKFAGPLRGRVDVLLQSIRDKSDPRFKKDISISSLEVPVKSKDEAKAIRRGIQRQLRVEAILERAAEHILGKIPLEDRVAVASTLVFVLFVRHPWVTESLSMANVDLLLSFLLTSRFSPSLDLAIEKYGWFPSAEEHYDGVSTNGAGNSQWRKRARSPAEDYADEQRMMREPVAGPESIDRSPLSDRNACEVIRQQASQRPENSSTMTLSINTLDTSEQEIRLSQLDQPGSYPAPAREPDDLSASQERQFLQRTTSLSHSNTHVVLPRSNPEPGNHNTEAHMRMALVPMQRPMQVALDLIPQSDLPHGGAAILDPSEGPQSLLLSSNDASQHARSVAPSPGFNNGNVREGWDLGGVGPADIHNTLDTVTQFQQVWNFDDSGILPPDFDGVDLHTWNWDVSGFCPPGQWQQFPGAM